MRMPIAALLAGLSGDAIAATITVTTNSDTIAADGQCSLREAITAANTDSAFNGCPAGNGVDEILLGADEYRFEIEGAGEDANASGDLDIRSNLSLRGAGADLTRIRGDREDRVFDVASPATDVVIEGVTIRNGAGDIGGGILLGAGVSLLVKSVSLTGNATVQGGGIASFGTLDIVDSVFHANDATTGGAVWSGAGSVTSLRNVTLDSNTALDSGSAASFNDTASLNNVTASQNIADSDFDDIGDGAIEVNATVTISNTILARNLDLSLGGGGLVSHDCAIQPGGELISLDHNLIGIIGNACVLSNPQPGDQAGTPTQPLNPLLQPFDLYGGSVETFLPTAASPVVEAGSPLMPGSGSPGACEAGDARGVLRPQGARCDIGAAELDDLIFRDGFDPALP
ncbi:MAG TPA: CSLREA domain-containing protein [Dokdonella sp.]|uniref:CSLREA domain-containing protein n=1 Tax=Dokdonella sp. TaxID=2291710 RepID=UPI002D801B4C|nr:CSLREA domain-containing protein [Dokdonella sp.]HET9033915.1 CSLREA domain-containing protein [Dokdonella sp.]